MILKLPYTINQNLYDFVSKHLNLELIITYSKFTKLLTYKSLCIKNIIYLNLFM